MSFENIGKDVLSDAFEEKVKEAHDSILKALKLAAARKEDLAKTYLVCDFANARIMTITKENLEGLFDKLEEMLEAAKDLAAMQGVDGFMRILYFDNDEWATAYFALPVLYLSGSQTIGSA
jgi:hypothetical protein